MDPVKQRFVLAKIYKEYEFDEKTKQAIFPKKEINIIRSSSYGFEKKLRVKLKVTICYKNFVERTLGRFRKTKR